MCEDRSLQMRRAIRLNKIHHARLRNRMARRVRPATPTQSNNEPAAEVPTESAQMNHIPAQAEAAAPQPNIGFQRIPMLNIPQNHVHGSWEGQQAYQMKRNHLMNIAMRTVVLMRQNQHLQQKLTALQVETKMFMQSVMNSPENKIARENALGIAMMAKEAAENALRNAMMINEAMQNGEVKVDVNDQPQTHKME